MVTTIRCRGQQRGGVAEQSRVHCLQLDRLDHRHCGCLLVDLHPLGGHVEPLVPAGGGDGLHFTFSEEDGEVDLDELFADGHLMCNKEYERKLFKKAILLQT